eukprot:COSAG05_NODE_45_length_25418_cov_92.923299_9_plen_135_part_00
MEGADETHDEDDDYECDKGKHERPVHTRGQRRQQRHSQVRHEVIEGKAEKSVATVQASEASLASGYGSEPPPCRAASYARLELLMDGEGKPLKYYGLLLCHADPAALRHIGGDVHNAKIAILALNPLLQECSCM